MYTLPRSSDFKKSCRIMREGLVCLLFGITLGYGEVRYILVCINAIPEAGVRGFDLGFRNFQTYSFFLNVVV